MVHHLDADRIVQRSNAFDFFFTGTLPWILIVGSGVVTLLLAGGASGTSAAPWPIVLLGATGLGTLLVFLRVVSRAGDPGCRAVPAPMASG